MGVQGVGWGVGTDRRVVFAWSAGRGRAAWEERETYIVLGDILVQAACEGKRRGDGRRVGGCLECECRFDCFGLCRFWRVVCGCQESGWRCVGSVLAWFGECLNECARVCVCGGGGGGMVCCCGRRWPIMRCVRVCVWSVLGRQGVLRGQGPSEKRFPHSGRGVKSRRRRRYAAMTGMHFIFDSLSAAQARTAGSSLQEFCTARADARAPP